MRSIHQLFIEADQEVIRRATIERGRNTLCWYPSADTDFRHIRMLESEGLGDPTVTSPCQRPIVNLIPNQGEGLSDPKATAPLIYMHTDIRLPQKWGTSKTPVTSPFFVVNNQVGPGMRITSVTEIHPKRVTRHVSREVCSYNADENIGRVLLVEVEMDAVYRGRLIRVPIPILYFIAENLSFLVHVLLCYQIRIDTLIHIKDGGGSMGGSQIPMNFIYQAAPVLKLKRVVCDASPEAKTFNTRTDYSVLMHEAMQCERHDDRELSRLFQKHIRETSECDVRAAWEGTRIERGRIPHNDFRPPDDYYYDWRLKGNAKSEQGAPADAAKLRR